ncbi:phage integrase [Deferribacter desulfuricans SSM1]|uniref:Phage integrase n=1 Tax=Deferribacter desulfuricans (strain DSM 14783 / JCM 11476 / NBRC 101012 / SSM1) TaxID=639282 RepID=D3PB12_DEFDS|nr:tyrosine-type recombinase/integrase [Deferribacter desulfuricans]BAI79785.1 phage integrase [Deferribacter desulfuricans SSM1]
MKRITDATLRAAKPKKKIHRINVGEKLFLEVRPTGNKFWRFRYRDQNGKDTYKSLGEYPYVSLSKARQEAEKLNERLKRGLPLEEEKRTFDDLFNEWVELNRDSYDPSTLETKLSIYNRDIKPYLGNMDIKDITSKRIIDCLKKIADRDTLVTMKKAKTIIHYVYELAISEDIVTSDLTTTINSSLPKYKEKNYPAITEPAKLKKLIVDIDNYRGHYITKLALKFLMITFVRPGMVRSLEWCDIDFENKLWFVPADKMKIKRDHIVPLSDQAVSILKKAQKITGDSNYVFSSPIDFDKMLSNNTLNQALRRIGYTKKEHVSHSFRQTASTLLNEMGWPPYVIEKQLAHEDKNKVRRAYNKAEYLEIRKEMMQFWANYLDELKNAEKPFLKRIINSDSFIENFKTEYVST